MPRERLKSPRTRLFVALELPSDVREGIVAWQRRELVDEALRVTPRENLHITLVFLGWQRERDIVAIAEILRGVEGEAPRVRFEPQPVGKGKSRQRPGLFALDAPSEGAERVHAVLSDHLQHAGFYEPEKRRFWSHVTVARVRPEKHGSRRPMRVSRPPGPLPRETVHPFDAVRLSLYRSILRPQGAEYASLATKDLPRRGEVGGEKVS
jgi:2'-5' RNA ligase